MSEPTSYDLVQDDRIIAVENILSKAAEPPSGTEFSYPVVGQAVSSSMWQWVTKGVGNGIIDLGDSPYWLRNFDNATNTARLVVGSRGTANAIIEGFYHQLSEDMTISLPMPSSGTITYHVCLTYDPRDESSQAGPISVQVYSGTPPTTFNRIHVVLWTVRRQANQLLTDAVTERFRPRVAPVIYVWDESHKPDPAQQLWGSLCVVGKTGSIYRSTDEGEAGGSSGVRAWVSLTDPQWEPLALSSLYTSAFAKAEYRLMPDGCVEFRGGVKRANGAQLTNSGNLIYFGSVPGVEWSRVTIVPVATTGGRNNARVETTSGGLGNRELSYMVDPGGGSAYWLSLDGVRAWVK